MRAFPTLLLTFDSHSGAYVLEFDAAIDVPPTEPSPIKRLRPGGAPT